MDHTKSIRNAPKNNFSGAGAKRNRKAAKLIECCISEDRQKVKKKYVKRERKKASCSLSEFCLFLGAWGEKKASTHTHTHSLHSRVMSKAVPISDEEAQRMLAKEQQMEQNKAARDEQRESMLRALVNAEGRERLKRIEQVKADRARYVESQIVALVQAGKLQPPVSDDTVREILAQCVDQEPGKASHITVVRKRNEDDW